MYQLFRLDSFCCYQVADILYPLLIKCIEVKPSSFVSSLSKQQRKARFFATTNTFRDIASHFGKDTIVPTLETRHLSITFTAYNRTLIPPIFFANYNRILMPPIINKWIFQSFLIDVIINCLVKMHRSIVALASTHRSQAWIGSKKWPFLRNKSMIRKAFVKAIN